MILCMNAKEILKILKKHGFYEIRQSGSHIRLSNGIKNTTVAYHGKKDVPIKTVKSIEKQTGVKLI